jgi:hypothetical protein
MAAGLLDRTHALIWSHAPELRRLYDALMVRLVDGCWGGAAMLDWEFALSGSPLADLAGFLRYERARSPLIEPHFSAGYQRSAALCQTTGGASHASSTSPRYARA